MSIRLPQGLADRAASIAGSRRWSRNAALVAALELGIAELEAQETAA